MDYYPQNLLELLINQGKYMSLLQKLLIITNIIKGISWLADNYVCHRDIKPTNIMIGPNKIPKIIDFGSCCPVNGANKHFKVKSVRCNHNLMKYSEARNIFINIVHNFKVATQKRNMNSIFYSTHIV